MGGAVKVIPAKPNVEAFGADLEATLEDTKSGGFGYGINGMVNIPLAEDKSALRIVG